MGKLFSKLLDLTSRISEIWGWLALFAGSSGVVTTLAMLREVPWYYALIGGATLAAALLVIVCGLDYLSRVHSIRKKITLREVRGVVVEQTAPTKFRVRLGFHLHNSATRPIWFKIKRLQCMIERQAHEPMGPQDQQAEPMEIQPQLGSGGVTVSYIENLDLRQPQQEGHLELEVAFGKKKDDLSLHYETKGRFFMYPVIGPGPVLFGVSIMQMSSHSEYR